MSDTPPPKAIEAEEWEIFTGKALLASTSPWGTLAGGLIAWLVARYGIGLDAAACNLLAGGAVVLASYVMRYFTKEPITGIVVAKPMLMKLRKIAPSLS